MTRNRSTPVAYLILGELLSEIEERTENAVRRALEGNRPDKDSGHFVYCLSGLASLLGCKREMLLTIAGEVRDGETAGDNEAFNILLAQLTGKTLEDYRKELAAKWKALTADIDRIPTRIDEAQRAIDIIIQPDYDKLKADKAALEAQLAPIDEGAPSAAASRLAYKASARVQEQIYGLKTRQQELALQADRARREAQYQRQQRRAEANPRQAHQTAAARAPQAGPDF